MPELALSPLPMLASGTHKAKATGLSKLELLRRASTMAESAPKKRSCFSGVTQDRKYWRAQTLSGEYIGTYKSEKAAAAATANQLDVSQGALRRKRARYTDIDGYVEKFKVMLNVYTNKDSSIAVMSDLTSAADAMQQWPLLSVCAPGLHFASLMGKMGPWRQEVGTMWEKVFRLAAVTSVCQSEKSMLSSVSLRSLQHVEATMGSAICGLSDNPHNIYILLHSFSLGLFRSVCLFWSVLGRPNFLCCGHSLPVKSLGGRLDQDRLTSDGPSVASRCNRDQRQLRFDGVEYPCRPQQLVVFRISQMGRQRGAHQDRCANSEWLQIGCNQQYRHGVKRGFCEIAEVPRGRVVFAEVPHSQNTRRVQRCLRALPILAVQGQPCGPEQRKQLLNSMGDPESLFCRAQVEGHSRIENG